MPTLPSLLYVAPESNAKRQAETWRATDPPGARIMDRIARRPQALWLGHEWVADPFLTVASTMRKADEADRLASFVVYDIMRRDFGAHSSGGAKTAEDYLRFVAGVAAGLAGRPALVVLEPDAICHVEHLSAADLARRFEVMSIAVDILTGAGARVYIDAGSSDWLAAPVVANRLKLAGVNRAQGFATNVSHCEWLEAEHGFAADIRKILPAAHYVVDTSRNGAGPEAGANGTVWCNPLSAKLGADPTLTSYEPNCDALLWIKPPGESDGLCNGGPGAGNWWPEYARRLGSGV